MSKRRRSGRAADRVAGTSPLPRPTTSATPARSQRIPQAAAPEIPPSAGLRPARPVATAIALATGAAALILYVATLSPTVATGDSGELTTAAAKLWLAHPPGYPTFTILGHIFSLVPLGDAAYRVNVMSAILDALGVVVTVLVIGRLIEAAGPLRSIRPSGTQRRGLVPQLEAAPGPASLRLPWLAATAGGLVMAVSTAFWRYSLSAEVFALNNLLALLLLLLMLEWSRRPDRMRYLWISGLIGGLSLTNQQTIVFVAPALVGLLVLGVRRYIEPPAGRRVGRLIPWGALGIAILLGLAGLVPYLYLPLAVAAGAPSVWGDPTTLGGFLAIVGRTAYGTLSFTVRDASGSPLEHVGLFAGYLVSAFTPIGLVLAAVGTTWLAIRRTGEAVALGLWFLVAGPVFLAIANPPLSDPVTRGVLERFYILPSLPVAIAIGVGVWLVAGWLAERALGGRSGKTPDIAGTPLVWRTGPAVALLALAALVVLAAFRLPEVDLSKDRVAEAYANDLLGGLPANTFLLMRSDENYSSVTYAQEVRGLRPDIVAVDVELLKLDADVARIQADHPDIHIPFARYDDGVHAKLADLVGVVIASRPVFVVGELKEDLTGSFDVLDKGLADEILPNGGAADPLATLRDDPGIFDRLHAPDRTYPETTWEAAIEAHYADVAFKTGVALQALGPQANAAQVEHFYRAAIRLSPTLASAYKNLGILLQTNGGTPAAILPLWQRYLELVPDDPEADAIRAAIDRLRGQASAAP